MGDFAKPVGVLILLIICYVSLPKDTWLAFGDSWFGGNTSGAFWEGLFFLNPNYSSETCGIFLGSGFLKIRCFFETNIDALPLYLAKESQK